MPFQKGNKANTKENRIPPELKKACTKLTRQILDRLTYWLHSDNPTASVKAAKILLERGYGKVKEHFEISGVDGKDLPTIINITLSDEWKKREEEKRQR